MFFKKKRFSYIFLFLWLCYVFFLLGAVADDYFCPALTDLSKTLGLGVGMVVGIDLPVNVTGDAIRSAVLRIREDASVAGALVTTHKVAVWEHARDLFKEFDEHAQRLCEVSCLSRNPQGALVGHAKDPVTAGTGVGSGCAVPPLVPASGSRTADPRCRRRGGGSRVECAEA